ncbi:MAG TPA: sulfatase [Saprospiraceae bacterium]|nr:sulfatase [Saprospiraceae bacterium]
MNTALRISAACLILSSLISCQLGPQAPTQPNFLLIIVDDLGYTDLSIMGSDYYETPHIDQIAREGVIFTEGYAACAVCSPSRASLMTGTFVPRHGITDYIGAPVGADWRKMNRHTPLLPPDYQRFLPHQLTTIPEALKTVGYNTFFAGKWHLGSEEQGSLPTDHGFDINQGGFHAGGPYTGGYFSPFNNPFLKDRPEEKGMSFSMKLAKETSAFIETQDEEQPFFACLSFYAVHAPIQTSEDKWSHYRDKADSMGIAPSGFGMERILPIRQHQDNPVYAGLVEQVDEAVGQVLATLEAKGLDENTVILFTSDHGGVASGDAYATNNAPLRGGKGYQWEGGLRVPFFLKVPWMNHRGQENSTPVMNTDILPTFMDLAQVPLDSAGSIDGKSLVPVLQKQTFAERPLYWHYPHYGNQGGEPHAVLRQGSWKLIHYWEDDRDELYNLAQDLSEENDLAAQEADRTRAMRQQLLDWLEEAGATYPVRDSLFDPAAHAAKLESYRTELLPRLERQRAAMLSPDWQPNEDWWGSKSDTNK